MNFDQGLLEYLGQYITEHKKTVMERVLRVVRHRGFALCALTMETRAEQDCQQLRITVTVESVRPIQQLWSQLVKLVDVSRVDALEQQPRIRA